MSRGVWKRFARRPRNRLGLWLALALALPAAFADFIANDRPIAVWKGGLHFFADPAGSSWALWPPCRHGPYTIPDLATLQGPLPQPPSADHPLGTDNAGRDTLARLVHGARTSLGIGMTAALVQVLIGAVIGVLAGFFGGIVDIAITRVAEVLLSFPLLLLLLAAQGVLERTTLLSTMLVIALTGWADTSRLVRAQALRVREMPYVEASRGLGSPRLRTLWVHVVPNCLSPAIVAATLAVGAAILLESALSFLGFGAPEPTASWGLLMADGFQDVLDPNARILVLLPGVAIFAAVSAFNLIGEGLRDALDPRHQGRLVPSAFITSDQKRALSPMPKPGGGDPTPAT